MHIGALLALRKVPTPTILANLSVRSAALRLTELDRNAAVTMRADGTFCGVVCQASLVAAIARYGEAAFDQTIGDIALDRNMTYCSIHDTLRNVLWRMSDEGQSFIGVANRLRPIDLVFRDELADWWLRCRRA